MSSKSRKDVGPACVGFFHKKTISRKSNLAQIESAQVETGLGGIGLTRTQPQKHDATESVRIYNASRLTGYTAQLVYAAASLGKRKT